MATTAARRYEQFHGRPLRRRRTRNFHTPKKLIVLGRAVAIEYECSKYNGGGDGTKAIYRHEFDPGAILCMDERGRTQLYVIGDKIKVTDAGVEH